MSVPQRQISFSVEEYLELERQAEARHEYLDGQIYLMAGESIEHSTINANLTGILFVRLVGSSCRVLSPNMKVRTSLTGLYAYPDVAVVYGEPLFHDNRRDILTNPTVIIEVLSRSTERYDRSEKFFRYQQLASLTDYLLVAQHEPRIEHFMRRPDDRWLYSTTNELTKSVLLDSINCELRLSEVFDRIIFPPPSVRTSSEDEIESDLTAN